VRERGRLAGLPDVTVFEMSARVDMSRCVADADWEWVRGVGPCPRSALIWLYPHTYMYTYTYYVLYSYPKGILLPTQSL
jgi:hypothetical protein